MKAVPLLIQWHDNQFPIYSVHFQPDDSGKLATGGGDGNVRLWTITSSHTHPPTVTYLSTLSKHTQAVNVVRWCPTKNLLASAGDDGNVLLWMPVANFDPHATSFGEDELEDKESWKVNLIYRSMGSEIYDLAWSPNGSFIVTGSMDNIVRIYNAYNGQMLNQITEHSHYVQGVSWDPLNQFIATQSSDRSVHVHSIEHKTNHPLTVKLHAKLTKMEHLQSSQSPEKFSSTSLHTTLPTVQSPASTPNEPKCRQTLDHSSNNSENAINTASNQAISSNISVTDASSSEHLNSSNLPTNLTSKPFNIYLSETYTSFFRRLAFSYDGSLLLSPAGQYKGMNTVYIYTRSDLASGPVAYLPGYQKPTVAVCFSPQFYSLRQVDYNPKSRKSTNNKASPAFSLPYRMIFAVISQDSVYIYDTQQTKPISIINNLHYAFLTDLSWSNDGNTLIVSSSDGFCSAIFFAPGELGEIYHNSMLCSSSIENSLNKKASSLSLTNEPSIAFCTSVPIDSNDTLNPQHNHSSSLVNTIDIIHQANVSSTSIEHHPLNEDSKFVPSNSKPLESSISQKLPITNDEEKPNPPSKSKVRRIAPILVSLPSQDNS